MGRLEGQERRDHVPREINGIHVAFSPTVKGLSGLRALLLEFALQFLLPIRRQPFQLGLQFGWRSDQAQSCFGLGFVLPVSSPTRPRTLAGRQ